MLFRNQILDNVIASFDLYFEKKKLYCQRQLKTRTHTVHLKILKQFCFIMFMCYLPYLTKDKHSWYADALYDSQTIRVCSFFFIHFSFVFLKVNVHIYTVQRTSDIFREINLFWDFEALLGGSPLCFYLITKQNKKTILINRGIFQQIVGNYNKMLPFSPNSFPERLAVVL